MYFRRSTTAAWQCLPSWGRSWQNSRLERVPLSSSWAEQLFCCERLLPSWQRWKVCDHKLQSYGDMRFTLDKQSFWWPRPPQKSLLRRLQEGVVGRPKVLLEPAFFLGRALEQRLRSSRLPASPISKTTCRGLAILSREAHDMDGSQRSGLSYCQNFPRSKENAEGVWTVWMFLFLHVTTMLSMVQKYSMNGSEGRPLMSEAYLVQLPASRAWQSQESTRNIERKVDSTVFLLPKFQLTGWDPIQIKAHSVGLRPSSFLCWIWGSNVQAHCWEINR